MQNVVVVPLTVEEQMRLAEALGGLAGGMQYWGRASIAATVRSIDGVPVQFPQGVQHIRSITKSVGSIKAIAKLVKQAEEEQAAKAPPAPKIEVRALDDLESLDLAELCGDLADVRPWFNLAFLACSVRSVDGMETKFPKSVKGVRALVKQIGDAGMEAADAVLRAQREESEDEDEGDGLKN